MGAFSPCMQTDGGIAKPTSATHCRSHRRQERLKCLRVCRLATCAQTQIGRGMHARQLFGKAPRYSVATKPHPEFSERPMSSPTHAGNTVGFDVRDGEGSGNG